MAMTKEEISKLADAFYNKFNEMSVLELHDLTKSMEKTWGYAAAPIQTAVVVEQEEIKSDEFKVTLVDVGPQRIKVIKAVRVLLTLGLKEAKELVESAPTVLFEDAGQADVDRVKEQIGGLGATLEIK